jgi:NAD(P)H-hydrate epimerase
VDWEQLPVNAIAAGPGLGKAQPTVALIKNLIDEVQSPLILDADALNILADNKTRLAYLPSYSILTPHRKEFQRLAGSWENDGDLIGKLTEFAKRYTVIVVLKGAYTAVALPDGRLYYNTTGNPGMATAGSGDVLTGILLALLAQGYTPVETALLGVYLHGLAGDEALQQQSEQSLTAGDITEHLGKAFKQLTINNL